MDVMHLIDSYPRKRSILPPHQATIFAEQYKINREGGAAIENLAQRLEAWMHRKVAGAQSGSTLEIGAGTLNQLKYEVSGQPYDVIEPFKALYVGKAELKRIRHVYDDIADVPLEAHYERITSVAVLEHLTDLPRQLASAALLLAPGGVFQAGIPSEGGLLWWIGWRFSTGLSYYFRTGQNYGNVMRHEHVNSAPEIIALVRHFFADVRISRFPLPFHHASFYAYLEARAPRLDRARALLALSVG
jgi:SAM-dependent methyltransferase